MKKYIAVKENGRKVTHIKVEVMYNKGGLNMFTYRQERKGYYVSVLPVEREQRDGYTMEGFSSDCMGMKMLVKEVARRSAKAEQEAEQIAEKEANALAEIVCKNYGLELA